MYKQARDAKGPKKFFSADAFGDNGRPSTNRRPPAYACTNNTRNDTYYYAT